MPQPMIVLILYINLLNLSWIKKKCLFGGGGGGGGGWGGNMEPFLKNKHFIMKGRFAKLIYDNIIIKCCT